MPRIPTQTEDGVRSLLNVLHDTADGDIAILITQCIPYDIGSRGGEIIQVAV